MPKSENAASIRRTYDLKNYALDQSDKFIKLYVTLTGADALSMDNVHPTFCENSFSVKVCNLNGNDYEFSMKSLLHEIVPAESIVKLKKDTVFLMLKKKSPINWPSLTMTEQQLKERQENKMKPKQDDSGEPGDGMMNIMKQMYESGDDEMKRNIAKAWTESREKQMSGEQGGGMGGMGGMMGGMGGMMGGMGGMMGAMGGGKSGGMPDLASMMGGMGDLGGK